MNAAALLLVGAMRHYGWEAAPEAMQDGIWNVAGSLAILALLSASIRRDWSPMMWAVAVWFAAEELLVVGCATAQLANPLPHVGSEQCTSHVGFKLGAVGLVVLAVLGFQLVKQNSLKT